ncbi:ABC transporter ATP-binding protein [Actinomadura kijaniata]|uniref:ABC transporter ATP-binding protein n=1 Tax=Actinomadura kijaniata TaxID=46161 RepID=UPI003F1AD417
MTADPGGRPGRRELARAGARAAGLVWRAAPVPAAGYLAATVAGGATPIAVAWLTKLALDRLAAPRPLAVLAALAAGLAVAGLVGSVTPQFGHYLRAEVARRSTARAKDELFTAVERFAGLARFEDPAFLDRLRLAQQSAAQPQFLVEAVLGLLRGLITMVGFVGALALISPPFTVVVLAAAGPALLIELRLSRRRAAMLWRIGPAERREIFYGQLLASADAAKEIRLLGLGGFLRGRMLAELRVSDDARRRMDRRELVMQGLLSALGAALAGGGLVWALLGAGQGRLTVGDVALFVAAVAGVQGAVDGMVGNIATAHQQLLMFRHYTAVLGAGPDLPVPAAPRELPELRRGIELRDVWFRYSDDHPWVLRGVDLFIPHGRAVALVGRNGGGKSTLVKLLCRFYDPCRGEILWDGVRLDQVPVAELRARIGAVFQDFMAYDFSAADNIAVGDLAALDRPDLVERAARQAGVHGTLAALPRGYGTLLTRLFSGATDGDDPHTGVNLSGGQWQRVALARAFLRADRDLMILDEPSAGLDAEAEHEVHARLREIRAGRTSVLISHRLGAIRDADVIAVLDGGTVTERGTHAELLAADGTYARMFHLQAAGYTGDPDGGPPAAPDVLDRDGAGR